MLLHRDGLCASAISTSKVARSSESPIARIAMNILFKNNAQLKIVVDARCKVYTNENMRAHDAVFLLGVTDFLRKLCDRFL
jgi:hypothetical protein